MAIWKISATQFQQLGLIPERVKGCLVKWGDKKGEGNTAHNAIILTSIKKNIYLP